MELASHPLLCVPLFQPAPQDRRFAIKIGNVTPPQSVKAQVSNLNALQLLLFDAPAVRARAPSNSVVSLAVVLHLLHVSVVLSVRTDLASPIFKLV
jgi:hypothetical protein